MADNLNTEINTLVTEWSSGVDRVLKIKLRQQKIGKTGNLKRGIKSRVVQGNNKTISFLTTPYSGRLVDMGAGSGQTARQARSNRQTRRKPKRWYGHVVFGATNTLEGAVVITTAGKTITDYENNTDTEIEL